MDQNWPTIRKFPRTLHEAFPGHGDYSDWFFSHKRIRPVTEIVVGILFIVFILVLTLKVI